MDMQSLLDAFRGIIPEHWIVGLTVVVTICAALATALPAPKPASSTVYRTIYAVIQWIACNFGKAKNAQDQRFIFESQKTIPNDGKR